MYSVVRVYYIDLGLVSGLSRHSPGKIVRRDPANPTWDPRSVPGGIPGSWDPRWEWRDPAYIPPEILPGRSQNFSRISVLSVSFLEHFTVSQSQF